MLFLFSRVTVKHVELVYSHLTILAPHTQEALRRAVTSKQSHPPPTKCKFTTPDVRGPREQQRVHTD
jgi:hypothetical protein